MANWRNIILSLLVVLISGSCDENYVSSIPSMPVSLKLDLSGKYNTFRNSSNVFLLFETPVYAADRVGFGGILVYSGVSLDDNANSVYYAFDMACTHEAKQDAKVYPIEGELGKVKCSKCGSVFDVSLGFGSPVSGPAKEILRKYKVTVDPNQTSLYVYR